MEIGTGRNEFGDQIILATHRGVIVNRATIIEDRTGQKIVCFSDGSKYPISCTGDAVKIALKKFRK